MAASNDRDSSYTAKSGLPYVPSPEFSPFSPMPPQPPTQRVEPSSNYTSDSIQLFPESVAMSGTPSARSPVDDDFDYMEALESSTLPPGAANPFKSYPGVGIKEVTNPQTPKYAKATDSWVPPSEWVKHSPGGTTELRAVEEEDPCDDLSAVLEAGVIDTQAHDAVDHPAAPPTGITSGYFAPQTEESRNFDPPTGLESTYSDPQTGVTPRTGLGGHDRNRRYSEPTTAEPTYMTDPYTERTLPTRAGSNVPPLPTMPDEFRRPSSRALPRSAGTNPFDPTTAGGETRWTSSSWAGPTAGVTARNPDIERPWYSAEYDITGTAGPRSGLNEKALSPGRSSRPQTAVAQMGRAQLSPIDEGFNNPVPAKLAPGQMVVPISRARSLVQDSGPQTGEDAVEGDSPSRGLIRGWRGYGLYVNALLTILAAVALNMAARLTSTPLSVVMYAPTSAFGASAASTTEISVHIGLAGWCADGSGNTTTAGCRVYVGMDFTTVDGTVSLPDNTLLTIADSAMNVLSPFSCLLALYTLTAAVLQILVMRATDLELSFLSSSLREDEIEQEIALRCRQRQVEAQFWLWWGHTKSPLGHLFVLICHISCFTAVTGATIGIATIVPAVATAIYLPLSGSAVVYLMHARSGWRKFVAGPSGGLTTSSEIFSNENMRQIERVAPQSRAGGALSGRRSSAKRRSKKHRWTNMAGGRRPSSESSFASLNPNGGEGRPARTDGLGTPRRPPSEIYEEGITPYTTGTAYTPGSVRPSVRNSGRLRAPLADTRTPSMASAIGSQASRSVASELGDTDEVARWHKGYQESRALLPIIRDLRAGDQVEPYVLSDDGLLYIYVEDDRSDMDIAKLVPPDGEIRGEVLEEAYGDLLAANPVSLQGSEALELIMTELEKRYWWSTMGEDVAKWLGL